MSVDLLADSIIAGISDASALYHRLILVLAKTSTEKTQALQVVSSRTEIPVVNANLEISSRLLDLTERQRSVRLPQVLRDVVSECAGDKETILIDSIEILFDVSLKQDPLKLLQGLSRNQITVVAWAGRIDGQHLIYAEPGHPEYRCYPIRDIIIVSPDS